MIDSIFISGVLNESHLIYVASYINQLKSRPTANYKIYFENNLRFLSRKKIETSVIEKWLGNVELVKPGQVISLGHRKKIVHIFIGSVGIKPAILMRLKNPTASITNVVVDEGIGSAADTSAMVKIFMRERNANLIKSYIYAYAYIYIKRGLLANKVWRLFDGEKSNRGIISYVKEKCAPIQLEHSNYILLLTQPWIELGILTESEYEDYITQFLKKINAANVNLVIKAHPSENTLLYKKLGIEILDTLKPVELCFDLDGCKAVLGFNSTSLILLNIIYGIPTFRLSFEKLDRIVSCSEYQESLFYKYSSSRMSLAEILELIPDRR